MTEVILGCGCAWLIDSTLTADPLRCVTCCTAQPVLVRCDGATSGRIARYVGGRVVIETLEAA